MTIHNVTLENNESGTIDDTTLDGLHPTAFIGDTINMYQDDEGTPVRMTGILQTVD